VQDLPADGDADRHGGREGGAEPGVVAVRLDVLDARGRP
jgi:hypothetical protein